MRPRGGEREKVKEGKIMRNDTRGLLISVFMYPEARQCFASKET